MFNKALPIWLKNKETEKNIQAKFKAEFIGSDNTILKITGATNYKVFLNGTLIHYGPSHGAKGYFRVDVVNLKVNPGAKNTLLIEAAGYNCRAYAAVSHPSFVQAEVVADGACIVATGFDFEGFYVLSRVQKTLRYSFQRHFTEVWNLSKDDIRHEVCTLDFDIKHLVRRAPLPDMAVENISDVYCKDTFAREENTWQIPGLQGAVYGIGELIDGFNFNEIQHKPLKELSEFCYTITENKKTFPCVINPNNFVAFKCAKNTCGLINLKYKAERGTKFIIAFDEKLVDGKFDCRNWDVFNVIEVNTGSETSFTNFETYGFQYFAVFAVEGTLEIEEVNVVKIRNPIPNPPKLNCADEEILKIYDAACESARCNSLGIFMDCPTRERAGWLCDSYFTAPAVYKLEGNTFVEDDFVENFALAKCADLPHGMLPMCYPADHPNHNHIPQWAMWYVLELNQYKDRNKNIDIADYKELAYKLLKYFNGYENELGLLEDLPGWNFVEWSKANEWTDGINFPTNMLYSFINKIVGEWYGDTDLTAKAEKIKNKVLEMSFDGKFFRDQALRNEHNVPVVCEHISEACQYYAFMFDIVDTDTHNDLYKTLVADFIPESGNWPEIEKANALMGMYMRMELMLKWGHAEQLIKEIKLFFGHMADITGTLWEHKYMAASLNHGFTAYLCVLLLEIFNN